MNDTDFDFIPGEVTNVEDELVDPMAEKARAEEAKAKKWLAITVTATVLATVTMVIFVATGVTEAAVWAITASFCIVAVVAYVEMRRHAKKVLACTSCDNPSQNNGEGVDQSYHDGYQPGVDDTQWIKASSKNEDTTDADEHNPSEEVKIRRHWSLPALDLFYMVGAGFALLLVLFMDQSESDETLLVVTLSMMALVFMAFIKFILRYRAWRKSRESRSSEATTLQVGQYKWQIGGVFLAILLPIGYILLGGTIGGLTAFVTSVASMVIDIMTWIFESLDHTALTLFGIVALQALLAIIEWWIHPIVFTEEQMLIRSGLLIWRRNWINYSSITDGGSTRLPFLRWRTIDINNPEQRQAVEQVHFFTEEAWNELQQRQAA